MLKHRIFLLAIWVLFVAALIMLPGFEVRGLALGLIIGCWPVQFFASCFGLGYQFPFIQLLIMSIISGLFVFLCAWLMDKARIKKGFRILLVACMGAGALFFHNPNQGDRHE